ncbi:hypothetical protein MSMTP_0590 [Methanosarcina sp. MTP4]|uniref:hypothetical protein n=1 Tax=Methanosarcina sp. MTP4 TaxID=1434100 RepID=UPI000615D20D|nr:hypothetical protein [Methanosarcina sp. MTP4]AKB24059.1 hypothetical protein MSMTP_0590 [Methanosarcina sp. MTP4]
MIEKVRRPSIIQEELSELNELIVNKEQLVEKYPDKFSLKIGLYSLKEREEYLLKELEKAYERLNIDTFDFVFDGEIVQKHRISLSFFGKFTSALQEVVTSISQSMIDKPTAKGAIPKEICAWSQLDLIATAPGSFRMILASHQPHLENSIQKKAFCCLNELTDCEDDKEAIKAISKEIGIRSMKKYQNLVEIIYKNNATIKMYDKIVPEGFHTKEITSPLAKRIYDAISDVAEMPDETVTYYGKLTGVNVRSFSFEFVIEDTNEIITGSFGSSLAEEVKRHLDSIATIEFNVSTVFEDIIEEEKKKWTIVNFVN